MKILSQSEQWPERCASSDDDHWDRPTASEAAAEDWERERQRKYPRGSGPPLHGEDDPHDLDPYGAALDDADPDLYLSDPGFVEEEVDLHPDPDHMRDYREAGTGHRRDVDPGPPGHASQEYLDYIYGPGDEESPLLGGMLEDLARHPERAHPFGTPVYTPGGGIPHEDYDPNSLDNLPPDEPGGEDVHHFGAARFYDHPEPERAIRNDEVTIMHVPEEEGPGYDAIVRKSPDGKGWDVLKPLN